MHACYLLRSRPQPQCSYVGFTVNPPRRIRQHNGELKAGAKRTRIRRPWDMVCVVHGLPTKRAALQFEWQWQHPFKSTVVRDAVAQMPGLRKGNQYRPERKLQVLQAMLAVAPWKNYALQVWHVSTAVAQAMQLDFTPLDKSLPDHMQSFAGLLDEHPPFSQENLRVTRAKKGKGKGKKKKNGDEEDEEDAESDGESDDDDADESDDASSSVCSEMSATSSVSVSSASSLMGIGRRARNQNLMRRAAKVVCLAPDCVGLEEGTTRELICPHCGGSFHSVCLATASLDAAGAAPTVLVPDTAFCVHCTQTCSWPAIVAAAPPRRATKRKGVTQRTTAEAGGQAANHMDVNDVDDVNVNLEEGEGEEPEHKRPNQHVDVQHLDDGDGNAHGEEQEEEDMTLAQRLQAKLQQGNHNDNDNHNHTAAADDDDDDDHNNNDNGIVVEEEDVPLAVRLMKKMSRESSVTVDLT